MKKTPLQSIALLLVTCFFVSISCKKKDTPPADVHNGPFMQKWNLVTEVDSFTIFNSAQWPPVYYTGVSGDYMDFRTDNKVFVSRAGKLDTLLYSVNINDMQMSTTPLNSSNIVRYQIVKLTNDSLYLFCSNYPAIFTNLHDMEWVHLTLTR